MGLASTELARSLPDLARAILPAVLEAGRIEMGYWRSGTAVTSKADRSPVTVADQEAEAVLVAALAAAAPGVPVVAEELTAEGHVPEICTTFFLVDPLDGTKEFVAGRDEFTVNVALVVERRAVFGIVYAPARAHLFLNLGPDQAFEASIAPGDALPALGSPAFRQIHTRAPDTTALVALQSRSHSPTGEAFLDRLTVCECRRMGSSVKFCLIARGEADVYGRLGPTCEWDTAAGHAVLAAAGGCVTSLAGEELLYGHKERAFTNPEFIAWGRKSLI